jgi:AraC-like DNA-binding protein
MDITFQHISRNIEPFVSCVWASRNNSEVRSERIIPDGGSCLVFNFGGAVTARRTDGSLTTWKNSFFAGLTTSYVDITYEGRFEQVGVIFKPFGAFHLMNLPMSDFLNAGFELDLVDKHRFQRVSDEMADTEDLHQRMVVVCRWLELTFASVRVDSFVLAATSLLQKPEEIAVNEIADHMGRSQQHVARMFNKYTGIDPKKLQRILRFQKVLQTLTTEEKQMLTATAYQCNYFDQPHFNNEIRSMSGFTPSQLVRQNVLGSLRVIRNV